MRESGWDQLPPDVRFAGNCRNESSALDNGLPTSALDQACDVKILLANLEPSTHGPSVWTGRALQAENGNLEKLVLRFCIRPIDGAFELLAIMDIRARSISFTTRPRRPDGPPDHERAGETFLHLLFQLADLGGKANYYLRRSA